MIFVLGHKVPDTDAITSALVYANYLTLLGTDAKAISLGEYNKETLFILDYIGISLPSIVSNLPVGSTIALVDHNEEGQSIEDRKNLYIHSIVDHHKVDFSLGYPIAMRFEPVASTNSILYKMYKEANIDISRETALLMISGILSDTLYFRSPTTTEEDKKILTELNKIVNIENLEQFAMNMFTAKSDLGNISPYQLVKEIDAKDFIFGGKRSLIACIETTNPQYCLDRKHEIIDEIQIIKQSEGYDFILFCIVDILQEKNTAIIASPIEMEIVKKVFDSETMDGIADLGNRISRKKTIVPPMESVLG